MGESRAGVEVAGNTVAFGPAAWTGLFPGSLGRVPVANKRRHQQIISRGQGKERKGKRPTLLVNCFGDAAILSLIHLEDALVDAALSLNGEADIRFLQLRGKRQVRTSP
jgi:hypothetical protein